MNKILIEAPLNSTSLGQVTYNILRELRGIVDLEIGLFPIGGQPDLSAFGPDEDMQKWLEAAVDKRYAFLKEDIPTLKIWHLSGSEQRLKEKSFLLTFHETDFATKEEVAIVQSYNHVFFCSEYTKNVFNLAKNTSVCSLGLDKDIVEKPKNPIDQTITFGLIGKFEKRKHTARILEYWAEKFGNDKAYRLVALIYNPFIARTQQGDLNQYFITQALKGQEFFNINFIPRLNTNAEVNNIYNHIDINLSGLSGAEDFNLPAFNSTALGKTSIVLNASGHTEWANDRNSILIDPSSREECYDGIFFHKGNIFNQGNIFSWSKEEFFEACDRALQSGENLEGKKLKEKTYKNVVDKILNKIQ